MSEKIGSKTILASIKLGVIILSGIFIVYTFQWFTGGSNITITPLSQNVTVHLQNKTFTLDSEKALTTTTQKQYDVNFARGFLLWVGIIQPENITYINKFYIEEQIQTWEQDLRFQMMSEGNISISEDGTVTVTNPAEGLTVHSDHIMRAVTRLARKPESNRNYEIHARVKKEKPHTDKQDLVKIKESLQQVFEQDFLLSNQEYNIEQTLTPKELYTNTTVTFNKESKKHEIIFDSLFLEETLKPYTSEAQDASFIVDENYTITIEPSRTGLIPDIQTTHEHIVQTLSKAENVSTIAFLPPTSPEFTTEDAKGLEIKHMVSSFTTYFSCCQARSRNIQKFAELIDGAIVRPGEEFNLNTYVGQRTAEKGFEPAGTLVKGVLIETTGGGISQFATTFYNAVFWGGYEDVYHKPHSRYFSRYPEGIEATISWPEPHLIFRNNTDSGILIKTSHTDTSVTVSLYGDNDGRIVSGDHTAYRGTRMEVIQEGGDVAKAVSAEVSEPEELHDPQEVYYVDSNLQPNAIYTKSIGRPNYKVEVVRNIHQDEQLIETNEWTVRYLSEDAEFLVQDCQYAPEFSVCKTEEDLEKEKEELLEFYEKLESGNL